MTARLLIVGPQGSGKGTQGVRVAEAFGIPAISTGDIFRRDREDGTELGQQVTAIIEAGNLVPDELTSDDRARPPHAAGCRCAASCSTATRATSARCTHLDAFLDGPRRGRSTP